MEWFSSTRLFRLWSVLSLFNQEKIVGNFSNMGKMFHRIDLPSPEHVPSPLPAASQSMTLPVGAADWIIDRDITALVVLQHGKLVFEDYFLGTGRNDRRISWSMGKSFLATIFGLSVEDGSISSLDDPVVKYVPSLVGSAYETATIRNVLNMASGVDFNEDYLDFWSDINKMGRTLALGGSLDVFAAAQKKQMAEPGTGFHYVSVDTHVLGMVLRGATGRDIPELINERLFVPLRLERDPYYLADAKGNAFVLGGLNMTTRDYARFGQMVLQNGHWMGQQVIPESWIAQMTAESAPRGDDTERYGFQWWLPADQTPGEVYARGVYGQYIWIDRNSDAVVVVNAAHRGFREEGAHEENVEMMRAIARGLG